MIEVFDLFETEFIRSSTIFVCSNNLFGWKGVVTISIFQMILIYDNDKWRYCLTARINVLDYNDPFPIAKLYSFSFLTFIVRCHNKDGCDLTYKKAGLIEVPDIAFYNTVFGNYILEKSKPNLNDLWVFVLGPLVIVRTIPTRTKF